MGFEKRKADFFLELMIASGCIELHEIPLKKNSQSDAEYREHLKASVQKNKEQLNNIRRILISFEPCDSGHKVSSADKS